jgi:hypothetical protein
MNTAATDSVGRATFKGQSSGLWLLGGAVVLLVLGVIGFDRARIGRLAAERDLAGMASALNEAHGREQLAQRNSVLLAEANTVQQRAQTALVLPGYWSERQINMRQQSLPREQMNAILQSTARSRNQLFNLESMDLAVTHPDEGLFDPLTGTRYPLMVSLKGALRFRISDRPL